MREIVALACVECAQPGKSVYWTTKNKRTHPDRMQLKKYCRWCRKHAPHREKK